jgi:hypothetical protein
MLNGGLGIYSEFIDVMGLIGPGVHGEAVVGGNVPVRGRIMG